MTDLIVLVRYPDRVRRAVIRQNRYKPSVRKRTKSGRAYAQVWHIVRWIDEPILSRAMVVGSVRGKRGKYGKRKTQAPRPSPVADAL
jgi:hypothetical protein